MCTAELGTVSTPDTEPTVICTEPLLPLNGVRSVGSRRIVTGNEVIVVESEVSTPIWVTDPVSGVANC